MDRFGRRSGSVLVVAHRCRPSDAGIEPRQSIGDPRSGSHLLSSCGFSAGDSCFTNPLAASFFPRRPGLVSGSSLTVSSGLRGLGNDWGRIGRPRCSAFAISCRDRRHDGVVRTSRRGRRSSQFCCRTMACPRAARFRFQSSSARRISTLSRRRTRSHRHGDDRFGNRRDPASRLSRRP